MPDPMWLNSVAMDAGEMRRAQALGIMPSSSALSGRQGVRPGGGLAVSVLSGTITVTPGAALIHGVTAATQGAYWWAQDVNWTTSLTAAHATLGRKDLVYIRVRDSDVDTSGAKDTAPVYLAGTASSTPATPAPAAGTSYLPLAVITVPSSGSGQPPSVDMSVRPYTVASGGILPVASQTERDAISGPYAGLAVYRIDTGTTERYSGTAWRDVVERHVLTVEKSGTFSLNPNVTAYDWLSWSSASTMTDSSMWTVGQSTRLYAPVAGAWLVTAGFPWPAGALECRLRVRTNGSSGPGPEWQAQYLPSSSGTGTTETARIIRLSAGDYIEVGLYHNTGSTLTNLSGPACSASMAWMHP
ncbi:hypothetical protein [Embleya sp. NPDC005971]|uniref:hypothetical protein n=1 Tax=Embleya sp. NPDC005971 TaxID=3156724 RepID=UPI0033EF9614